MLYDQNLLQASVIAYCLCCISTGGPHNLCDRLYFELIEEMYGNVENPRIIVLDCDKYSHLPSK